MKNLISILMLTLAMSSAGAAESAHKAQNAGIGGGAIIGAVAGGPVGAIIGAAIGGHYADTFHRSAQLPETKAELSSTRSELATTENRVARLNRSLFETRGELAQLGQEMGELLLERAVFEGLQMEVMYPTGNAQLTASASDRLQRLAQLLGKIPDMTVRLDGFADPRGAATYNLTLSRARADSVRETLIAAGIAAERISVHAHGEATSEAGSGDTDAYALERRVRIRLFAPASNMARVALGDAAVNE